LNSPRYTASATSTKEKQKNALRYVATLLGGAAALIPLTVLLALPLVNCQGNYCPLLFIALVWAAAWLLAAVVPYRFLAKAYATLGKTANSDAFRKAAKWSWRGAPLLIALIGALFILAARIYALKGYRTLKQADANDARILNPPPTLNNSSEQGGCRGHSSFSTSIPRNSLLSLSPYNHRRIRPPQRQRRDIRRTPKTTRR
jgi:uncharacterized membrane protein